MKTIKTSDKKIEDTMIEIFSNKSEKNKINNFRTAWLASFIILNFSIELLPHIAHPETEFVTLTAHHTI